MEGSGVLTGRTYFAEEITVTSTKHVKYVTTHDKHLIAAGVEDNLNTIYYSCLLYTSPSPRDRTRSRMPSSA